MHVTDFSHYFEPCMLKVLDCRICGDLNTFLRFAFIEYANERMLSYFTHNSLCSVSIYVLLGCNHDFLNFPADGARQALDFDGTVLGYYPIKVMPSKTAILPVNPTFLPRVSIFIITIFLFIFMDGFLEVFTELKLNTV